MIMPVIFYHISTYDWFEKGLFPRSNWNGRSCEFGDSVGFGGNGLESVRSALDALQKGDTSSFTQIRTQYDALLKAMVSRCLTVYHYEAEFDDLMQEASLALYKAAQTYDLDQAEVTFGLYAKICVRNRLISAGRSLNRQRKNRKAAEHGREQGRTQKRSAEFAQFGELAQVVDALLSDFEKSVFSLYMQGSSYKEMACTLGKSEKAIDNAICRIKNKLKKYIKEHAD